MLWLVGIDGWMDRRDWVAGEIEEGGGCGWLERRGSGRIPRWEMSAAVAGTNLLEFRVGAD